MVFDPDTVVLKPKTDWSEWLVSTEGHAAKNAKTSLPRRVSLGAFSKKSWLEAFWPEHLTGQMLRGEIPHGVLLGIIGADHCATFQRRSVPGR